MTNRYRTALIFIIPTILIGMADYLFLLHSEQEADPFDSRVRFLSISTGQESRIDALDEIYVEGEINGTILKEFEDTVRRHNLSDAKVIFDSPGGDLDKAIDLGNLIRKLGFSTGVGTYTGTWNESDPAGCYSACTVAFLGGKFRYFSEPSEFGVHQYRSYGIYNDFDNSIESEAQRFSGKLIRYIREMGVSDDFYHKTVDQGHDDVELLSEGELIRMNAVNNGAEPATWEILMDGKHPYLKGTQEQIGQNGNISILCGKRLSIRFEIAMNQHENAEIKAMKYGVYSDGDELDASSFVEFQGRNRKSDPAVFDLSPDEKTLIQIMGSDSFGLILEDSNNTRFLKSIEIKNNRKKIKNFISNCNIGGE